MPPSSLNASQAERSCHRHICGCRNLYPSRPPSLLRVTAQQWTGVVSLKHWKTSLFSSSSRAKPVLGSLKQNSCVTRREVLLWREFPGATPEGVASRFFEEQLYLYLSSDCFIVVKIIPYACISALVYQDLSRWMFTIPGGREPKQKNPQQHAHGFFLMLILFPS